MRSRLHLLSRSRTTVGIQTRSHVPCHATRPDVMYSTSSVKSFLAAAAFFLLAPPDTDDEEDEDRFDENVGDSSVVGFSTIESPAPSGNG